MTQNEIIEMARQAGKNLETSEEGYRLWTYEALEAFAKLVAAKKHEELYRLAEDAPVRGDARETRQNILHAIRGEA
jgi:hypothetical protein